MIRISHSTIGRHRHTQYIASARIFEHDKSTPQEFSRDGVQITLLQFADNTWWITPNFNGEEDLMADIGPYETVEEAAVMMRLLATSVQSAKY